MTTWRMALRSGNQGQDMSEHCFRHGVAAITYRPLEKTDLSKFKPCEPKELWKQLAHGQKGSLKKVAYRMKAGDIIYVKDGLWISNRGRIRAPYHFDSAYRIKDDQGLVWAHQVEVDWDTDFHRTRVSLESEPTTVLELKSERLQKLERAIDKERKKVEAVEVEEGQSLKLEAVFRMRNAAIIRIKKENGDYRCEACGFHFAETYGEVGNEYIVAHHRNPIAGGQQKTTLDDIALVCANCHAMIHRKKQPLSVEEIRALIEKNRNQRRDD